MPSELDLFHELAFYTLAHGDPAFIHQHAVDAFAVQTADSTTKPIAVVFGLVGLYLHVEKNFTGRHVQKTHMQLAKRRKAWSMPPLPTDRGSIRIGHILAEAAGPARDAMIHRWCASVWESFQCSRAEIVQLLALESDIV
jgi:hypothetical protein